MLKKGIAMKNLEKAKDDDDDDGDDGKTRIKRLKPDSPIGFTI